MSPPHLAKGAASIYCFGDFGESAAPLIDLAADTCTAPLIDLAADTCAAPVIDLADSPVSSSGLWNPSEDSALPEPRQTERHRFRVHGERRYFQCMMCDKTFGRRTNFKDHLNVHFPEKLFSCTVCRMTFKQKDTVSVKSVVSSHGQDPLHDVFIREGLHSTSLQGGVTETAGHGKRPNGTFFTWVIENVSMGCIQTRVYGTGGSPSNTRGHVLMAHLQTHADTFSWLAFKYTRTRSHGSPSNTTGHEAFPTGPALFYETCK
ncbi:hypothetical protein JTE90_010089 [Oedothorax gibbosus]|uniref:C2H2-type domain-containing protein n=1 Tax=Oedothorax gibbosus TaxID=931172 RepID=A0AAV6U4R8_9ARAC|nr:hypothetical protein JTE90_010089 [Oedothorax gibbosus]